jgi:carbohydrate-selective porin OprB
MKLSFNPRHWNAGILAIAGLAVALFLCPRAVFGLTGADSATTAAPTATATAAPAAEAPSPAAAVPTFTTQPHMLNWGPGRQKLADKGFSFDLFYITDALADPGNPTGTDRRFSDWQRIRGTVNVDFGKFSQLKGLSLWATGLWQNGTNMGGVIGSIANPSGLVSSHQFRLDSITLTQQFLQNKVSVQAGIFAARDFYGLQPYGGSFVMEPLDYDFGNMGNTRMSYDPESSPAVNLKITPNKYFAIESGYFLPPDDGEQHDYPTGWKPMSGSHGNTWDTAVFYNTFVNHTAEQKNYQGQIQVGFSYNGSKAGSCTLAPSEKNGCSGFVDYGKSAAYINGTLIPPPVKNVFLTGPGGSPQVYVDGNSQIYGMVNQPVYRVAAGSNRGLDLLFGVDMDTKQSEAEVPTEFVAGAVFNGPIACRPTDTVAFGMAYDKIGSDFNNYQKALFNDTEGTLGSRGLNNETQIEINYNLHVFPWMQFMPVYQHYSSVGGSNKTASVAGMRVFVDF